MTRSYKANELPEGSLMRFKMEPFDTALRTKTAMPSRCGLQVLTK